MDAANIELESKRTLSHIIEYIGADDEYKTHCQLVSYIEDCVRRCR